MTKWGLSEECKYGSIPKINQRRTDLLQSFSKMQKKIYDEIQHYGFNQGDESAEHIDERN